MSIANDNAIINNAAQYNGAYSNELDRIIMGIMDGLSDLKKADSDKMIDVLNMAREELTRPQPRAGMLRNCLELLSPMFTVVNGLPVLTGNLQKLADFISQRI